MLNKEMDSCFGRNDSFLIDFSHSTTLRVGFLRSAPRRKCAHHRSGRIRERRQMITPTAIMAKLSATKALRFAFGSSPRTTSAPAG